MKRMKIRKTDNFRVSDPVMWVYGRGYHLGIVQEIGKRKVKIKTTQGEIIWLNKNRVHLIEDKSLKHKVLRIMGKLR